MAKWARTLRRARRRLMFLAARQLVRSMAFERIPVWGSRIGTWQFRLGGRARDRVLTDLARLQGRSPDDAQVRAQLQASYRSYAIATMQVLAMCDSKLDLEVLKRACRIDGLEHLQAAKQAGKGAILLANHAGNSLILCAQLASLGWPITIVYRQARMMSDEFFAEGLPRYGIEGVMANEGARAYAKMRRAIKNNRIVYVMIDQGVKTGSDGIVTRFLGKDMPMPAGPAQLARQSGAPVFPIDTLQAPPIWHFVVEPAVQFAPDSTLEDDVKQLVAINERQILARPEIWSWPHRRWRKFRLASA